MNDLQRLYDDPAVVRAMEVLNRHGINGEQYDKLIERVTDVLGATVLVNRDPLGSIEVVREKTRENGVHLYRYKLHENGSVVTYGVIEHQESEGAYALMHKALGQILVDQLVDD
jgi:hypothetical protein